MTVSTSSSNISYLGNGVTVAFPFPYPLRDATHLHVYNDGVLQAGTYAITGVGTPSSAVVTYTTAPAAGVEIFIERVVPFIQLSDYVENDPLPAATLESDFDLIAMGLQQLSSELTHTLRIPEGEVIGDMVLPSKAQRASKIFAWDAAGLPIALSALDQSALTVTPSPGGTPRLLGNIFGERINVKNFGAAGDGVQDDTAMCLAAIAAVPMAGGAVYFPSGIYEFSAPLLSMNKSIYFVGEGQHTELRFTGCDGIVIDNSGAAYKLPCGMQNLRLSTWGNGANTAFSFEGPDDTSIEPQIALRDFFISGANNGTCWQTGISVSHAAQSLVDNYVIRGNTSDNTAMAMGLRFDNISTDVKVTNGSTTWCNFGCEIAGASESVCFSFAHFVMVSIGITTANMGGGHHLVVDYCHIAAKVTGIIVGNVSVSQGPNHSHITDCFFIRLAGGVAYIGISLHASRCFVTNNEFTFNEGGQSEIGIYVEGEAGAPATYNMIANNLIFNTDTAVLLGPNTVGNMVTNNLGADNAAKVVDNGTFNIVTANQFEDIARKEFRAALAWDPASIAAGQSTEQVVTVTGAAFGDFASVAPPYATSGLTISAVVHAANTVRVSIVNGTAGAINLGAGTWEVLAWRQ